MIIYRFWKPKDQKKLLELNKQASKDGNFSYQDINQPILNIKKDFLKNGGNFWLAQKKSTKQLVGMIGLRVLKNTGKLKSLRVRPNFRRQGIAKKLMAIAEEYAKKQDLSKLISNVVKASEGPQILHQKLGFKKDLKRQKEFGNKFNVICYQKKL